MEHLSFLISHIVSYVSLCSVCVPAPNQLNCWFLFLFSAVPCFHSHSFEFKWFGTFRPQLGLRSLWNHLQFSKPAQCVLYLFLFELSCWTFESYDDDDDNDDDDDDDDDDSDDVVCFACSCSICCPWQSKTTTQIAKFMIHTTRGNGHFPLRFSSIFYREVESLKGSVLLGVLVASLGKSIGFLWRLYWHSWTLWSLVNLLWVNVVNYLVRMTSQKKHPCQSLPFRHISPMATTEGSLARCSTLARDNLQLCHELLVRRVSC